MLQMAVALGGRIAEELIFGENDITTGASNDFQQVCGAVNWMQAFLMPAAHLVCMGLPQQCMPSQRTAAPLLSSLGQCCTDPSLHDISADGPNGMVWSRCLAASTCAHACCVVQGFV
jgi:hypothetical protein